MKQIGEAFGYFSPQTDIDAAVKFVFTVIFADERLDELAQLVLDGGELGGMEGEPGWLLERRDEADEHAICYSRWPAGARFRAYVDPEAYELACPEFFMDRVRFMGYLVKALDAHVATTPPLTSVAAVQALRTASEI
jgi:hypothetical protein